ncbi:MAG: hypothetical protein ACHRHE_16250 [Tepidisphaerales bacterium]
MPLMAEQRRLMELLKEERQAVIAHAVTRVDAVTDDEERRSAPAMCKARPGPCSSTDDPRFYSTFISAQASG